MRRLVWRITPTHARRPPARAVAVPTVSYRTPQEFVWHRADDPFPTCDTAAMSPQVCPRCGKPAAQVIRKQRKPGVEEVMLFCEHCYRDSLENVPSDQLSP